MTWKIEALPEVVEWLQTLDERTQDAIDGTVAALSERGPGLGRPLVDTLSGSTLHRLKELRPPSSGRTEVRILFVFDPRRRAILLAAGDKAGDWSKWYKRNIPVAERRYEAHLERIAKETR